MYYVRRDSDGKYLRGARFWKWTRHKHRAALHDSPDILQLHCQSLYENVTIYEETTSIRTHSRYGPEPALWKAV